MQGDRVYEPYGRTGVPGEVTTTIVVSRATLIHPVPSLGGGARSHRVLFRPDRLIQASHEVDRAVRHRFQHVGGAERVPAELEAVIGAFNLVDLALQRHRDG